jgi:anti-sigma B factor antagonist
MGPSVREPQAPVVCRITGEIDIFTVAAFRRQIFDALVLPGTHLFVDMSGVTFMDTSGLSVLVAAQRRARELGGALLLTAPSLPVRRALTASGLSSRFPEQARATTKTLSRNFMRNVEPGRR